MLPTDALDKHYSLTTHLYCTLLYALQYKLYVLPRVYSRFSYYSHN